MLFEFFKHNTTLSTGSLLLIVALLEKVIPKPVHISEVKTAIGCFIICILTSMAAMFGISLVTYRYENIDTKDRIAFAVAVAIALISFPVGLFFVTFLIEDFPVAVPVAK